MSGLNDEKIVENETLVVDESADQSAIRDPQPVPSGSAIEESAIEDRDWREDYLREVSQSRKYRQRAQRAEVEIEQLTARVLSDDQMAEYGHLREKVDELVGRDERIGVLEGMVSRMAGFNELTRALVACGVGSNCPHGEQMLSQASALLEGRIDVDVSGAGDPIVRVLDESGEIMESNSGPVTVQQFVAQWLAREGSHFLPASGDTGSGAHRGRPAAAGASIEQLDRDPKAKAEFIAMNGPRAYVQLARKR